MFEIECDKKLFACICTVFVQNVLRAACARVCESAKVESMTTDETDIDETMDWACSSEVEKNKSFVDVAVQHRNAFRSKGLLLSHL